jgi:hypothetical protein
LRVASKHQSAKEIDDEAPEQYTSLDIRVGIDTLGSDIRPRASLCRSGSILGLILFVMFAAPVQQKI